VANARHEVARLTDLERHLLPLLDGATDRAAMTDGITASVVAGRLHLSQNGQPVTRAEEVRTALAAILDQALNNIAKQALLVG
jgi:methyltransferase-like protein